MAKAVRRVFLALVVAGLLVPPLSSAAVNRADTSVILDDASMEYHAIQAYTGNDAKTGRQEADTNNDTQVDAEEVSAYEANAASARSGNQTVVLRWDASPTYWGEVAATTANLIGGTNSGQSWSLILDGAVSITSADGANHTLTVAPPATFSAYSLTLSLPPGWLIGDITGVSITSLSETSVSGSVAPGGLAVIHVANQPPPPPQPPAENDTVPPVVNAGEDRTIQAGLLTSFSGSALDNDPRFPEGASFWWRFTYNGTAKNLTGQNFSFRFWTLGNYTLTFSALDRSGNLGNASLRLAVVSPDLVLPVVKAGPDLNATAGEPVRVAGNVSDNDPSFATLGIVWWSFSYNGTPLNASGPDLNFTFWTPGTYTITLSARDPWGNLASDAIQLKVLSPDTVPPTVDAGADRSVLAGTLTEFQGIVADNDPTFPSTGFFWWTFFYNGTPVNISGLRANHTFWFFGVYEITLTAIDPWGNRAEDSLRLVVESPDAQAPAVNAGPDTRHELGSTVPLEGLASDNDPSFGSNAEYWWTFEYDGSTRRLDGATTEFRFQLEGAYAVTFYAKDGWGNVGSDSRVIEVHAVAITPPIAAPSGSNALLPAALLAGVGLALAGALAYRRRTSAQAAPLQALATSAQTPVLAAIPSGPKHVVEGLLILYKDGRLIHHQAAGSGTRFESPEVLGSMFTAVTEFIRDSFREEGALSRLTYGQNAILLDRSAHFFGAVIVYGEPDAELRESLKETLRRLESAYAGVAERWFGGLEEFAGIGEFVVSIFGPTAGLTRADIRAATGEKGVKLVSGTEHFKGYVRLRVALANQTDQKISDAAVTVVFNEKVLRLARIEPAGLERQGLRVGLGEIAPGERVGAIYYLDPQNCSQTNIEGIGTYRDSAGEERTVQMKPRVAEIVCPLFFTPDHASPATMKRLIETSLAARDSKLYRVLGLTPEVGYKEVFGWIREAILSHHVLLVRNIATGVPFSGKAWFYGQTKHTKSPVIIRATVLEDRRAVELFVAVDSPGTLTGLLAEFHRSFTEMLRNRAPGVKIEPVLDDGLKSLLTSDEFEAGADAAGAP